MLAQSCKYHRGISLVEIILALALFSIIVVYAVQAEWGIDDTAQNNNRIIAANNIANTTLLNAMNSELGATSTLPLGIQQTFVEWPWTQCESLLESESAWHTGWNSTTTYIFSFVQPNFDVIQKLGGDCSGQPKRFSQSGFTLEQTIDLGYSVSLIDINKNTVFASLNNTSDSDPDLGIVDLDLGNVSFLNIGRGIHKIDAVSGAIFAAQNSSTTQLAMIQSSPNLVLTASSSLPNVAGQRPEGVSIFYYDSKIYIGTKRTVGPEFQVFDVSNIYNPRFLGNKEMNHNINDIEVRDGLAFLATSGNIKDLIITNVHNPTAITESTSIDLPGNEDGKSVTVAGNYIFLGRYKSTVPSRAELNVLQYSTASSSVATLTPISSALIGGDVNDLVYAAGFVYAATNNLQKEVQIFKWNEKTKSLIPAGSFDLPAPATGIDIEDNKIVVSAGSKIYIYQ